MAEKEQIFEGLSVSPGIGIGTAFVRESGAIAAPKYSIARNKIRNEVQRFYRAVDRTRRQIGRLRAKLKGVNADLDPIVTHRGTGYALKENIATS